MERRFVRKWETGFSRDMQYVIYISPEDDKEKCKKKLPNYHCCGKETTKQCFFDPSPAPPPQCLKNLQTCGQLTEMTAMHQNVDLSNVRPISNRIIIITTNVSMI